ncbi:ficolin-1-like [Babylonia areolata]|uniref:ficolin-1-like n=1 Tax=Babylonia areolata TaxID=304850 RepID=UPI003FD59BD7
MKRTTTPTPQDNSYPPSPSSTLTSAEWKVQSPLRCRQQCQWWQWPLVTMFFLLTSLRLDVTGAQSVVLFQRATHCPGKALSNSLTYGRIRVRSKVQCAALCLPDFSCHSFLFHPFRRLCHLGSEPSLSNCSNMGPGRDLQHFDMTTTCHNGGVLQVGGSCVCPHGYMGDSCSIIMQDCDDLYHKGGVKRDGVYWVHPSASPSPFQVYCRMIKRPRTYVMNRVYNDVNFTRGWRDYMQGFGDLTADFWLGLDKLHVLTASHHYELRFRVRLRTDTNLFQFYEQAQVNGAAHNYSLILHSTKGDLGDCLTPANGSSFSTPDRDNDDNSDVHCAQRHMAGFWFHGQDCTLCNPTGPLLQPEDEQREGIPAEVFWKRSLGRTVPYKLSAYLVNVLERRKKR